MAQVVTASIPNSHTDFDPWNPADLKRPSVVSLFSGGGGLDLGLEAAGFSTLYATDIDEHSVRTLRQGKQAAKSRGSAFLEEALLPEPVDIRELESGTILKSIGAAPGEVDLLAGGPPCQAFSVFGKRLGKKDPRGMLAFEYLRILKDLRPNAFVFENVSGMLTIEAGEMFSEVLNQLAQPAPDLHYTLTVLRLNAVDYGVPQFRDRVFIIGHADGRMLDSIPKICIDPASLVSDPARLPGFDKIALGGEAQLPPWRTVRDAFRGLPAIGQLANHSGRVHSERIVERYRGLAPGERDHHTRINKLDLDRPSFTIIVGSDKGGGKGHVHPLEAREVTPRESARIQTFPDWWAFSGTSRHPIRQVGNAVPPLLAALVGNEIRHKLFGLPRRSVDHMMVALGQNHLFEVW